MLLLLNQYLYIYFLNLKINEQNEQNEQK